MMKPNYLTDLASELDNLSGVLNKYVDENQSCFLLMSPALQENYHRLIFELRGFEDGFRPSASVSNRDVPVDTHQDKVLHINDYRGKG